MCKLKKIGSSRSRGLLTCPTMLLPYHAFTTGIHGHLLYFFSCSTWFKTIKRGDDKKEVCITVEYKLVNLRLMFRNRPTYTTERNSVDNNMEIVIESLLK